MRVRLRILPLLVVLLIVSAPSAASAGVRLGLGGHYWLVESGLFDLHLAVDTPLASSVSVGGRFGALFTTEPTQFGLPLDFLLRATIGGRIYVEGLFGPWVFFEGDSLRLHAAAGFGLNASGFSFGLEVGWLEPRAILGGRFSFRF